MTRASRQAAPKPKAAEAPSPRVAAPRTAPEAADVGQDVQRCLDPATGQGIAVYLPGEHREWLEPEATEELAPVEETGPDSLAAWTARTAKTCAGCGLKCLDAGGRCTMCGKQK